MWVLVAASLLCTLFGLWFVVFPRHDAEIDFSPVYSKHTTRSRPSKQSDQCLPCQQLSDRYGIAHLASWGDSDWAQRACWAQQRCSTVPAELKLFPPAPFEDVVDRNARRYYKKLEAYMQEQPALPVRPYLLITIPTVARKHGARPEESTWNAHLLLGKCLSACASFRAGFCSS